MKFEYLTLCTTPEGDAFVGHERIPEYGSELSFNDLLDKYGRDGWELVTYNCYQVDEARRSYREMVFKRPLN